MAITTTAEPTAPTDRYSLLQRISIRAKILLAIIALAVVSVGVGGVSLVRMDHLNQNLEEMRGDNVATISKIADLRQSQAAISQATATVMAVTSTPEERMAAVKRIKEGQAALQGTLDDLAAANDEPGEAEEVARASEVWQQVSTMMGVLLEQGAVAGADTSDFYRVVQQFDEAVGAIAAGESARAAADRRRGPGAPTRAPGSSSWSPCWSVWPSR